MPTTTIVDGNLYVTTGSISGDTITHNENEAVEIFSGKIDYNLINDMRVIPVKVSKGSTGEKLPYERVIDLKGINRVLTVMGQLTDDTTTGSATSKRNNLINFVESKRGLILVWGTTGTYRMIFGLSDTNKAFIQRVKFVETAGSYGEAIPTDPPPLRKIDIQITFVFGKDM